MLIVSFLALLSTLCFLLKVHFMYFYYFITLFNIKFHLKVTPGQFHPWPVNNNFYWQLRFTLKWNWIFLKKKYLIESYLIQYYS